MNLYSDLVLKFQSLAIFINFKIRKPISKKFLGFNSGCPVNPHQKGLQEYMVYHMFADSNFMKRFRCLLVNYVYIIYSVMKP